MVMDDIESKAIGEQVAQVLFGDLKKMGDAIDAFRYESFARCIIAAQHGRPDAVEWAEEWYVEIVDGAREAMETDFAQRLARQALTEHFRQELAAGRSTNPRYQAFLDTVEDPTSLANHVEYLIWIPQRCAEYQQLHPGAQVDLAQDDVTQYMRWYADDHLSERVKRTRRS